MDLDELVGRAARSPQAKLATISAERSGPQAMSKILLFFDSGTEHHHHFTRGRNGPDLPGGHIEVREVIPSP